MFSQRSSLAFTATLGALACALVAAPTASGAAHSYLNVTNSVLNLAADTNGYQIPDFSHAGYESSNKELPVFGQDYAAKITLSNPSGDETDRIQDAIRKVSDLPMNASGYRGAVVLGAGTWNVTSLTIDADGVVLRGAGQDATIITSSVTTPGQTIRVGSSGSDSSPDSFTSGRSGTQWKITDSTVDVGSRSFSLSSGHGVRAGDAIIIEHPATAEWLAAIDNGGSDVKSEHWPVGSVPIRYHRYVTAVDGTRVTVDAPVMYSLVKSRSQSFVYKFTGSTRKHVGIENLTVDHRTKSNFDANHGSDCIRINRAENCWVRDVTASNFRRAGFYIGESTRITIANSKAIDPHSEIKSAQRYGFLTNAGQLVLFKDCYGRRSRHTFIGNGHAMDSGNVYLRCVAEDNYSASESGHQRWANGHLWDGCEFRHVGKPESGASFNDMMIWLGNHGDNSNGHGWASVNTVVYRSTVAAPGYGVVAKPPTGMNYVIASSGEWRSEHSAHGDYPGALNIATSGTLPRSLFEAQLAQRSGKGSPAPEIPEVPEVTIPAAPSELGGALQ